MVESSPPLNYGVTLHQFQTSGGIPLKDQIILLDNKTFFSGFSPVIYPYLESRKFLQRLQKILRRFDPTALSGVRLPGSGSNLFLGYFDKSFDNPTLELEALFQLIRKKSSREFVLIMGKGDWEPGEQSLRNMPENLLAIAANNINLRHPRVHYLPMGRDFRNLDLLRKWRPQGRKELLCYCNFSLSTHPIRKEVYEGLQSKEFIEFDHMGKFLEYSISRDTFLQKLSSAKFCICPRGNAVETFRMWDCLYVGTVPIVVKESVFHEQLSDLPILFLDDPSEFKNLDSDYLEEQYSKFLQTRYNYEKLTASYWLDSIGRSQ